MPVHKEERVLGYSVDQIFDLVIAVEHYPDFLPWCLSANVKKSGTETFNADLVIGFKILREQFSSQITCRRPEWIEVIPTKGPFKRMRNSWRFTPQGKNSCKVDFYVDFEFRSRLLNKLIGALFHEAVRRMVGAFEQRASDLYGVSNGCQEVKPLL